MRTEGCRPILYYETRRDGLQSETYPDRRLWSSIWRRRLSIWTGDDV